MLGYLPPVYIPCLIQLRIWDSGFNPRPREVKRQLSTALEDIVIWSNIQLKTWEEFLFKRRADFMPS